MAWTPGNTDTAMAAGGGIIGSVVSGLFANRQARKNREFQQAENQKERDFNAEQAELSRQWQEKMYNLHESPQAQAQAMRQAGIGFTDGIQNMSVGSASTASGGGSALPAAPSPWTGVGDAIGAGLSQLPFIKQQIKAAKLDNEQRALTAEKTRAETFKTWQEGYQTQIENGFTAEEKKAIINNLEADFKKKDNDNKLTEMQIQFIKDAKEAGVNPVMDAHYESAARIDKIRADIRQVNSDINIAKLDSDLRQSKGQYELDILKNEEYFSSLNKIVHRAFGADLRNLPPYISARILALFRVLTHVVDGGKVVSNGKELSYNDIVNMAKTVIQKYYENYDLIDFSNATSFIGNDVNTIMSMIQ